MGDNRGELSVVIAAFSGQRATEDCLASILDCAAVWACEIIVATNSGSSVVEYLTTKFPSVKLIQAEKTADVFALRSLGIENASGDKILLIEDHCIVSKAWFATFRSALAEDCQVAAGTVEPRQPTKLFDWALFCCEYVSFLPPVNAKSVLPISAVNAAYDRVALVRCRDTWKDGFYDNEVHDALRHQGSRFCLASEATVESRLQMSLLDAMKHLFDGGRRFGTYRSKLSTNWMRMFWILTLPLVPFVLAGRIVRTIAGRRPALLTRFAMSLPYVVCLVLAWSVGEACGHLTLKNTSDTVASPQASPTHKATQQ